VSPSPVFINFSKLSCVCLHGLSFFACNDIFFFFKTFIFVCQPSVANSHLPFFEVKVCTGFFEPRNPFDLCDFHRFELCNPLSLRSFHRFPCSQTFRQGKSLPRTRVKKPSLYKTYTMQAMHEVLVRFPQRLRQINHIISWSQRL
jgi:hypothetical protein